MAVEAAEPVVDVTLLGAFQVVIDGKPVDINVGITSGIVARLALTPGVTVSSDELVADLWDEATPGALNTIRSQVSRLRSGVMGDLIRGGRGGYSLQIDPHTVDVARLRIHLSEGELDEAETLWSRTLLPRLDRFPFVERERAALAASVRAAALRLGESRLDAADFEGAVAALTPAVADEPLHERPVLLLARALARAGRPSDALAQIDAFRRRLRDEQGLDLPDGAEQLRASIVRRDVAVSPVDVERHGVAIALTQLVGRVDELAAIETARLESRVVTLVGPGGVGKTRLAMESARRSQRTGDEVQWVIELADLLGSDILGAVADVLSSADGSIETVARQLAARRSLLILDNAEHVLVPVAEFVTRILDLCPGLAILVTSREALHLPGERVVPIRPWDESRVDDAITLFIDRVRDVRPDFEPTADDLTRIRSICTRIDGLPLGIELVASLADVLDLAELESSVEQGTDLFESSSAPSRHRSLTSVIDWSVGLLTDEERHIFAHLVLFAGTFTLDTVAGIYGGSEVRRVTASLAQKSLVSVSVADDGSRRYRMLESVRQYGASMLTADERAYFLGRHARWHADTIESMRDALRGPRETALQIALEAGRPDFHLALDTAIVAQDRTLALRLAGGLAWHWFRRNSMADGRVWLPRALAVPGEADPALVAWAYVGLAMFEFQTGDRERTREVIDAGLSAATRAGDRTVELLIRGYERYCDSLFRPETLEGYADFELPDMTGEREWVQAELMSLQGQLLRAVGRPAQALEMLSKSLELSSRVGYMWCQSTAYYISGKIMIDLRKGKEAVTLASRGIRLAQRGPSATSPLSNLTIAAASTAFYERHRDGARLFGAIDQVGRGFGFDIVDVDGDDAHRLRSLVRQGLTTAEWDELYTEGRRLPYARAIELALSLAPAE